jgi:beta-lactamase regulating signal transducer with metallopeptidase domain
MVLPTNAGLAPAIDRFSRGLLDTAARSLVLLGLVSLAVLCLRRASAATRHSIWVMGFAGLLLLPMFSAALPGWRILPPLGASQPAANPTGAIRPASAQVTEILPSGAAPSPESSQRDLASITQSTGSTPAAPAQGSVPAYAVQAPAAPQQSTVERQAMALPGAARSAGAWTLWIALLWLAGSVVVAGHLLLGHLTLWRLERRCARITDGQRHEQVNRLRQTLGVRRAVDLLSASGPTMPMTWGIWRAKLLLPDDAASWTSDQARDVLLHELGHVRRYDCATQLLARIACAFYWFNPLVWFAWNRLQIEREHACDDIVLNTGATASTYAQHLLQSATAMPALRFVTTALAMARPSMLESRMRAILDSKCNRSSLSTRATWMALGLLLIALLPVATLHAQQNPAEPARGDANVSGSAGASDAAATLGAPATRGASATPGGPATRPDLIGGGGRSGGRASIGGRMAPPAAPVLGQGPTCALDATIYDVRLPVDKIGRLDPDALAKAAATPADFEKALADLGTMRPLYHADQTVRLASDTISIGAQTPFITGSRTDANGHAINTVTYQQTGAIFTIAGRSQAAGKVDLDLQIQLSTTASSSAEIAPNVKASLFRTATMSHKGDVDAKTPFVLVSADAATTDENGNAVVYIARITLGIPQ